MFQREELLGRPPYLTVAGLQFAASRVALGQPSFSRTCAFRPTFRLCEAAVFSRGRHTSAALFAFPSSFLLSLVPLFPGSDKDLSIQ